MSEVFNFSLVTFFISWGYFMKTPYITVAVWGESAGALQTFDGFFVGMLNKLWNKPLL